MHTSCRNRRCSKSAMALVPWRHPMLQMLHEVSQAAVVAVAVNSNNAAISNVIVRKTNNKSS